MKYAKGFRKKIKGKSQEKRLFKKEGKRIRLRHSEKDWVEAFYSEKTEEV